MSKSSYNSKNRQKKCDKGLHEYKITNYKKDNYSTNKLICIWCNKELKSK